MAGSNWKQRCEAAEALTHQQAQELQELKALIAEHAPDLLERGRKSFTSFSPNVCHIVKALADTGQGEAEWIAHLGITQSLWAEWVQSFPELRAAIDQARARAVAFWDRAARQAMEANNSRFPTHVYTKWREAQQADAARMTETEDAAELVIFDLRGAV